MTKIKIQIPVSAEFIEREITLPAYRVNVDGTQHIKVISEEQHISVNDGVRSFYISIFPLFTKEVFGKGFRDCTREEFEKAYESVLDKLSDLQKIHA